MILFAFKLCKVFDLQIRSCKFFLQISSLEFALSACPGVHWCSKTAAKKNLTLFTDWWIWFQRSQYAAVGALATIGMWNVNGYIIAKNRFREQSFSLKVNASGLQHSIIRILRCTICHMMTLLYLHVNFLVESDTAITNTIR